MRNSCLGVCQVGENLTYEGSLMEIEIMIPDWSWQATAHEPKLAYCFFWGGQQAKNEFYFFTFLMVEEN